MPRPSSTTSVRCKRGSISRIAARSAGGEGTLPEIPDLVVYVERLKARIAGAPLQRIRLASPFVLRSVVPRPAELEDRIVREVLRRGKRIVLALEGGLYVAIHLMIAGRLRWRARESKVPGKLGLAAFDFPSGTLVLTEAGSKRRAAIHLLAGEEALASLDRGGLEVEASDLAAFRAALAREVHTLKRTLTDPRLFSGIGNAYSDEILHAAKLSPARRTDQLDEVEIARLYAACRSVLSTWTDRLRREAGDGFPEKVTAFREEMAVHGKYRRPCPDCGTAVQRIVYAENESNYCPRCQTGGRLLADRALSRLLHGDWPRTIDELESGRPGPARSNSS